MKIKKLEQPRKSCCMTINLGNFNAASLVVFSTWLFRQGLDRIGMLNCHRSLVMKALDYLLYPSSTTEKQSISWYTSCKRRNEIYLCLRSNNYNIEKYLEGTVGSTWIILPLGSTCILEILEHSYRSPWRVKI